MAWYWYRYDTKHKCFEAIKKDDLKDPRTDNICLMQSNYSCILFPKQNQALVNYGGWQMADPRYIKAVFKAEIRKDAVFEVEDPINVRWARKRTMRIKLPEGAEELLGFV